VCPATKFEDNLADTHAWRFDPHQIRIKSIGPIRRGWS
jgi:hypothetical protein